MIISNKYSCQDSYCVLWETNTVNHSCCLFQCIAIWFLEKKNGFHLEKLPCKSVCCVNFRTCTNIYAQQMSQVPQLSVFMESKTILESLRQAICCVWIRFFPHVESEDRIFSLGIINTSNGQLALLKDRMWKINANNIRYQDIKLIYIQIVGQFIQN